FDHKRHKQERSPRAAGQGGLAQAEHGYRAAAGSSPPPDPDRSHNAVPKGNPRYEPAYKAQQADGGPSDRPGLAAPDLKEAFNAGPGYLRILWASMLRFWRCCAAEGNF
uniref:Uncharacterized protein n=1 Tax=Coturnix japonica TaxID=93934 RepID=A0A8C2TGK8_COTJA